MLRLKEYFQSKMHTADHNLKRQLYAEVREAMKHT